MVPSASDGVSASAVIQTGSCMRRAATRPANVPADDAAVQRQAALPQREHAGPLPAELRQVLEHVQHARAEHRRDQRHQDDVDHAVLVEAEPPRLAQPEERADHERHGHHQPVAAQVHEPEVEDLWMQTQYSRRRSATFWSSPIWMQFTISAVPP